MLLLLLTAGKLLQEQAVNVSAPENQGVTFMYEEEKLARDVYDSMYVKWNLNPFGHIRNSERRHMQEMKRLVDRYGLPDPVAANKDVPGVFSNPDLQALYNDLVEKGSGSTVAALKAGALIEEVDIRDLKDRKKLSNRKDVLEAYDFLIMGSENHLRAFCRNLKGAGVVYEPAVLSRADFDAIITADGEMKGCGN